MAETSPLFNDSYRMVDVVTNSSLPKNGVRRVYNDKEIWYFKDTLPQSNIGG